MIEILILILTVILILTWLIEAIVPTSSGPITAGFNRIGSGATCLTTLLVLLAMAMILLSGLH